MGAEVPRAAVRHRESCLCERLKIGTRGYAELLEQLEREISTWCWSAPPLSARRSQR